MSKPKWRLWSSEHRIKQTVKPPLHPHSIPNSHKKPLPKFTRHFRCTAQERTRANNGVQARRHTALGRLATLTLEQEVVGIVEGQLLKDDAHDAASDGADAHRRNEHATGHFGPDGSHHEHNLQRYVIAISSRQKKLL